MRDIRVIFLVQRLCNRGDLEINFVFDLYYYCFYLQGEFVEDEFHGRGVYRHVSGVVYDGMWLNGFPAKMASKIHIVVEKTPLIIRQGTPFQIQVHCLNDDNEIVEGECTEF